MAIHYGAFAPVVAPLVQAALVGFLAAALPAQAFDTDYESAQARAIGAGKPMLVFVTGSDWNDASAAIVADQLTNKRLFEPLQASHALVHLDLKLRSKADLDIQRRDRVIATLRKLDMWRHDEVPCVIALDAKGRPRGRSLLLAGKVDRTLALTIEVTDAAKNAGEPPVDAGKAHNLLVAGRSLLQQRKVSEARAEALEALRADVTNVEVWDLLAMTASTIAKSAEVKEARAAVALSDLPAAESGKDAPLIALRWSRLGTALAGQKRELEAIFCFRHAMDVDRRNFEAGIAAAQLSIQIKDLPGALRDADEVLRRDFANLEALRIRAKCLPSKVLEGR